MGPLPGCAVLLMLFEMGYPVTAASGAGVGVPGTTMVCMVNHSAGRAKGRPSSC